MSRRHAKVITLSQTGYFFTRSFGFRGAFSKLSKDLLFPR